MENSTDIPLIKNGEVDLLELISALVKKKFLIIGITSVFAVGSVLYALYLPNIYRSEALLVSADDQSSSISSALGGLSGLAGMAGISLPDSGSDKKQEAIAIIQSHQFLKSFITEHDLIVPIMASTGWDKKKNEFSINQKLYDIDKKEWVMKKGKSAKPSIQKTIKSPLWLRLG